MIVKHKAIVVTLALVAFGYAGSAASYSYLLGSSIDFPYLCPVCPNIISLGSPVSKFVWRAIVLGTINALFFIIVGWTFIGVVCGFKYVFSSRPGQY
jgi:hypothetical protein